MEKKKEMTPAQVSNLCGGPPWEDWSKIKIAPEYTVIGKAGVLYYNILTAMLTTQVQIQLENRLFTPKRKIQLTTYYSHREP